MKQIRFFIKKLRYNHKKPFILGFLFLLCLGLTIGYAFLTTTLNINGTVNMASSRWDIHFENVNVTSGSVTATTNPTITNDTTVSFAATLENPGEFYEFTVDVVNDGTYDARISSLEITPVLTEDESKYFDYKVQYTTGFDVKEEDILLSGRRREIKVTVLYKINEDNSNYPGEDKDFPFEIVIDYEQLGKNYNPCTYEGELTNNASYQNGQYTYTYSTTNNGWSVGLTDRNSTDPVTTKLCTSINGKPIVNMSGMFSSSKASSIDLSSFYTSHVTNMSGMFYGASSLKMLDLSNFDTSNVTNMGALLSGTSQLEKINFSGWDFRKVEVQSSSSLHEVLFNSLTANSTIKKLDFSNAKFGSNMSSAFGYFSSLESINLHGVDTSQATNMSTLFYGDSSLQDINLSDFNTSNVTNMSAMFYGNSSLEALDLSDLETANVTNISGIFIGLSNLKTLNMSGLDLRKVSSLYGGTNGNFMPLLQELDISHCKFPSNMAQAFQSYSNLEVLNIAGVDTSEVTTMYEMFENDSKLTSIDLSDWDFSRVTDMGAMFRYCTGLKYVNLDGAGSDVLTTMGDILYQDTNIEEISMKNFNFGVIENIGNTVGPFNRKTNLVKLDLSGSKMTKVNNITSAFVNCSSLTTLNLSNIDAPTTITGYSSAFQNVSSLTEIDLSSFSFSGFLNGMFSGVTATVGYAKTQNDADYLNSVPDKPSGLVFTVKS